MKNKKKNLAGILIGSAVLAAAVAGIFFFEVRPREEEPDETIRPIKSLVVGESRELPKLYFPGTLRADSEVDLSFEVSGRLIEFPVRRGDTVKEGELLARLDPSNYENMVKNAEADLERAQSSLERIRKVLDTGAVSQEDYSAALAAREKAAANLSVQRKALADTRLTARFDGVVADTYADNFDTVAPGRPVLKLQDTSTLNITISVPESYMLIASAEELERAEIAAVFDWMPDRSFPLELKEFATAADPVTRTYRAVFTLDRHDDAVLLPDAVGTVVVERGLPEEVEDRVLVPSDAVGFTSDGRPFVWALERISDDVYRAGRRIVELGSRRGEWIEIAKGLEPGARIATAGITVLTEGRLVRPFEEKNPTGNAAG